MVETPGRWTAAKKASEVSPRPKRNPVVLNCPSFQNVKFLGLRFIAAESIFAVFALSHYDPNSLFFVDNVFFFRSVLEDDFRWYVLLSTIQSVLGVTNKRDIQQLQDFLFSDVSILC